MLDSNIIAFPFWLYDDIPSSSDARIQYSLQASSWLLKGLYCLDLRIYTRMRPEPARPGGAEDERAIRGDRLPFRQQQNISTSPFSVHTNTDYAKV